METRIKASDIPQRLRVQALIAIGAGVAQSLQLSRQVLETACRIVGSFVIQRSGGGERRFSSKATQSSTRRNVRKSRIQRRVVGKLHSDTRRGMAEMLKAFV